MLIDLNNPYVPFNLRALRKRYHLSRRSLALLAGISPQELRKIEHPKDPAPVEYGVLRRILAIFNLPAELLFHTKEPSSNSNS